MSKFFTYDQNNSGGRFDVADAAYAAYAADAAAMCDVIRDALTIDEVCAALGLDSDEVLA